MMFKEAAKLAAEAEVSELWLTHYSPSLVRPEEFMDGVREIFPNAYPGKDGKVQCCHLKRNDSRQKSLVNQCLWA